MSVLPRHAKRPACTSAKRSLFILAILCAVGWTTFAAAGGGPENVLLVVNPNSTASLTIANHYAQLRNIPAGNTLFIPWDTKKQTADIDTFRQRILLPVLKAIQDQRLANQIDYVIYSSDFPWGISLKSDVRKFTEEMKRAALSPEKEESGKSEDKKKGQTRQEEAGLQAKMAQAAHAGRLAQRADLPLAAGDGERVGLFRSADK